VTVSLPNFCPVRSLQSRRNMHTSLAAVGEFAPGNTGYGDWSDPAP